MISWSLAIPVLFCCGYLGGLALIAWPPRSAVQPNASLRLAVVVPAHNEEGLIGETVRSILATDYPAHLRSVVVVADNCTDATALRAQEAGAEVLVRNDTSHRGKGFALQFAFARLSSSAEAVAVVDADTVVAPNFLTALAHHVAQGKEALQVRYGVRNPEASSRARLMAVALGMFHDTRSLARERLGWSCGLRGNGMAFTRRTLQAVPYAAYSPVEDVEYGIELGLSGIRVAYVHDTEVLGEMVSSKVAARSQRIRWEGGRFGVLRSRGVTLVREAIRRRSMLLGDLALDLVTPPLSYVGLLLGVGLALETGAWIAYGHGSSAQWAWFAAGVLLAVYLWRGVLYSRQGWRGLAVLVYVPGYILWKVLFVRPLKSPATWVRTHRERR